MVPLALPPGRHRSIHSFSANAKNMRRQVLVASSFLGETSRVMKRCMYISFKKKIVFFLGGGRKGIVESVISKTAALLYGNLQII